MLICHPKRQSRIARDCLKFSFVVELPSPSETPRGNYDSGGYFGSLLTNSHMCSAGP